MYFDLLADATHILAFNNKKLVSHAAWVERELRVIGMSPLKSAYIEAVATDSAHQGNGFGSALMNEIPKHLQYFDIAALSPSEPDFYKRNGWEMWQGKLSYRHNGEIHDTPDEDVMVLRLPKTPATLSLSSALETDWRLGDVW